MLTCTSSESLLDESFLVTPTPSHFATSIALVDLQRDWQMPSHSCSLEICAPGDDYHFEDGLEVSPRNDGSIAVKQTLSGPASFSGDLLFKAYSVLQRRQDRCICLERLALLLDGDSHDRAMPFGGINAFS